MKVMVLVCRRCGYEDRVETLEREEAERDPRARPLRCPKCGSNDYDLRG